MINIKKISLLLIGIMLLTLLCSTVVFADTLPKVQVNGENIPFNPSPFIKDGELMLPLLSLSEKLEVKLNWDSKRKTVWVHKDMMHIEIPLGKNELYIHRDADFSGIPQTVKLKTPTKILKGRTILPAYVITDSLGLASTWDKNTKTFSIKTAKITKPTGKVAWVTMDSNTVKSMEFFNLNQEKIRGFAGEEMNTVMKSFNEATIDQNPYIQMIAGGMLKVTLTDGRIVTFTSYGSKTNVVATFKTGEEYHTYHLVAPAIAEALLKVN